MPKYGTYQSISSHRANIKEHNNYRDAIRGLQLNIAAGPRYVFFNSLANENNYVYLSLYGQGKSYAAQAAAQLQQGTINAANGQQISRMQAYINFISQMASSEGNNLNKYLQQMQRKFQDMGILSDELQKKFTQFFKQFEETGGTNYLQMIALINEVMQKNNQEQNIIDQMYLQMGNRINAAIQQTQKTKKEQQKEEQQTLAELFHSNINAYNKEINKVMRQALEESQFKINYAHLIANRFNVVIGELINSSQLLNIVEQLYIQTINTSIEAFGQQLCAYIIQQLSKLSINKLLSSDKQDLTNEIITTLQRNPTQLTQITDNFLNLIENQFEKRKPKKSIEQIALTTGRGTAKLFLQLQESQRKAVVQTYLQGTSITEKELKYIQNFSTSNTSRGKLSRASAILNKGIREQLQKQLGSNIIQAIRQKTKKIQDVLTTTINPINTFIKTLSIKVSGASMGEILTGKDFDNALALAIQSGGNKIKLKNDINIIINFNEEAFSQNAKLNVTLKDMAISLQTGFINKYLQKAGSAEDVAAAAEAYLQQLKEFKKEIDELIKKRKISKKQADQFLKNLSNMMQIGISVKDYSAGNNLGFHGGTLGANLSSVVNNIENMYQLGGLSKMDTDLLYFAIANCSPDAVAFGLKESIETYLAGAAAIMMFDEGFTAATSFMEKMKQELGGFDGMGTVHLFRVQGKLIPAAVVYGTIASNLSSISSQLQANMQAALQQGGNYVTINNSISRSNIPSFYNVPNPQDRWDAVSSLAGDILGDSNISFTFLGGVIDILNAIPQAFNI